MAVREAAAFLAERGIGAAPVVNNTGRAIGVLSRSDVLLAAGAFQAFEAMNLCLVRRVFVTDDEGRPVGVASVGDLFRVPLGVWGEPPASAA